MASSETNQAAHAAERAVYRAALRHLGVLLAACAVVGVAAGGAAFGTRGVWGALIGVGLAAVFCLATVWSVAHTVAAPPTVMGGWVFGTWILKLVVLVGVLFWLRGREFYHPGVLFAVVAVCALGAAVVETRAVLTGRIPYTQA